LNRALCAIKGTESQTSVDPSLNRAVILLDDVIEIRNNATAASSAKHALLFNCFAQDGENQYHAIFDNHICAIVAPSTSAVPLIAFDAQIELTSKGGKRVVPLEKLYLTPEQNVTREHSLRPGELLTAVVIPASFQDMKSAYQKYGEKDSHDWPIADAAVVLRMDGSTVSKASIVLGSAAPTPMRATAAEAVLNGKVLNERLAREAGKAAMQRATPLAHNGYKVGLFETAIYRTVLFAGGMMPRDRSAVGGDV